MADNLGMYKYFNRDFFCGTVVSVVNASRFMEGNMFHSRRVVTTVVPEVEIYQNRVHRSPDAVANQTPQLLSDQLEKRSKYLKL